MALAARGIVGIDREAGLPALLLEGGGALHALDVEWRAQDDDDGRARGFARLHHLLDLHLHVVRGVGAEHRHRAAAAAPAEARVVEDDVDVLGLADDAERLLELRRLQDGDRVDRVADAGAGDGVDLAERLLRVLRQDGALEAGGVDLVRGEDAEAAATADDGDAGAGRGAHVAEGDGEVAHLLDAVDAHGVDLPAEGVENLKRAGEAGGMRHNGARACGGAAALEDDRRLGGGRLADRLDEAAAVFDPLDVGADDLGLRVVREVGRAARSRRCRRRCRRRRPSRSGCRGRPRCRPSRRRCRRSAR